MYPRRLIESDFPIAEISRAAREGRSVHHGNITAIHLWWARKPLPSCRAAILAAGILDPDDPACPPAFRSQAAKLLAEIYPTSELSGDPVALRLLLLQFIADVAIWQHATQPRYIQVARNLMRAAHRALMGTDADGPPLLADPFAGGGSLPLEGLRLGCSAYASDLNPVAVLLGKVTLEYVQRLGDRLLQSVTQWSQWLCHEAQAALSSFYPKEENGARAVAYLYCRTIRCDGPDCGAEIPLTSKFILSRASARSTGLRVNYAAGALHVAIATGPADSFPPPTVRRGSAVCIRCGFTTRVERVRAQLTQKHGGAAGARLLAVVTHGPVGRVFRDPTSTDVTALAAAEREIESQSSAHSLDMPLLPGESLPPIGTLGFRVQRYGMLRWRDIFTPRQLLVLTTLTRLVRAVLPADTAPGGIGVATRACLALMVNRLADYLNTGCSWNPAGAALPHLFTRQALPIIWDFGEANPFGGAAGDLQTITEHVLHGLRNAQVTSDGADVAQATASHHPLPTDCAHLLCTDPPYYDAIPYADLSDFFYVWLKRMLRTDHPALFSGELSPREGECIVSPATGKDRAYFRQVMTASLQEARRITRPDGIAVLIFAHKSTAGWEDQLSALIEAGWIITASWPIDTENASRMRARNSAVLASSIHLVCRPRERPDGSLITDSIGSWRDVQDALPARIRTWLPRLVRDGVVGADALFACLGPALELFSRFARVERSSGEVVLLREYLQQVWTAVAREALSMIFEGADTSRFEADARLTAMWLWTVNTAQEAKDEAKADENGADTGADEDDDDGSDKPGGLVLEYDAALKMAMGLGVALEALPSIVAVKGGWARLLPITERAAALLGAPAPPRAISRKAAAQLGLPLAPPSDAPAIEVPLPQPGTTVLSRVHQAMLLFAAGRSADLKRFVVLPGVADEAFWRLAQALSALYPRSLPEKRSIDGLMASKKLLER